MTVNTETAHARLRYGLATAVRADCSAARDPANLTVIRSLTAIRDDAWMDRTIHADVLRGLLVEGAAEAGQRFELVGARVVGVLDLQGLTLPRILSLRRCLLDRVELGHAIAGRLDLSGCHVRDSVAAPDLRAAGQVSLRGMTVEDGINLGSARIDGTADLRDARLRSREPDALILTGARIGGSVRLDGAYIDGVIAAMGVRIDNGLVLNGATVEGRRRPVAESQTSVTPRFGNPAPTTWALLADHAIIGGAVNLSLRPHALERRATWSTNSVRINGGIAFFAATIGGNVVADYAYLRAERGYALTLETATVGGALLLRGATIKGGVRLFSAKVTAAIECDDGAFVGGPLTAAIDAQWCTVDGPVLLRNGFDAEGGVDALRASIGGNLECKGGHFYGRPPAKLSKDDLGKPALNLRDATVNGNVFLTHPFTAKGAVVLRGSDVSGSVNAVGGSFENRGDVALDVAGLHIERELDLTGVTIMGDLDLSHAQVTSFFDDRHSWFRSNVSAGATTAQAETPPAHLKLEGF
ncbi:hypothetical protein [Geodermatophilus sp. DSM 44513]|uniref:hypothetical protein n=1 Tax=Geodermatophilus sp. DSM 44513 TaxID=1528104 RepID=UPI0012828394|nr:hypothetical protein [Geodermatophilus sp. DSM 44513]WNV76710.1 hypothetical protein RTG05_05400 [Geodermatophilus sp. DSM 44513]